MANENNAIVNTEPRELKYKARSLILEDGEREQKAIVNQEEKRNITNTILVNETKEIAKSFRRKLYEIRLNITYSLEDQPELKSAINEYFYATGNVLLDSSVSAKTLFYFQLNLLITTIQNGSLFSKYYIFYDRGRSQSQIYLTTENSYNNLHPRIANSNAIKKYDSYYKYNVVNPTAAQLRVQFYDRDTTDENDVIETHLIETKSFVKKDVKISITELD